MEFRYSTIVRLIDFSFSKSFGRSKQHRTFSKDSKDGWFAQYSESILLTHAVNG